MRFAPAFLLLIAAVFAAAFVSAASAANPAFDTKLQALAKASSKSIPRAKNELTKLLVQYEALPAAARAAAPYPATLAEEAAAKTRALGEKLYAAAEEVSSLLGLVEHDEEFDASASDNAASGKLRASEACPGLVKVMGQMIDALPFRALVVDKDETLVKGAQLLGYSVSHALNEYSCRPYVSEDMTAYIAST